MSPSSTASPRELARYRSVPCHYCAASPGEPCVVVLRDLRVTRRRMVNVHSARIALAGYLG